MAEKYKETILLVEDDQILCDALCKVLDTNYHLIVESNIQNAIQITMSECVDLILLDIILPNNNGRSGLDLCRDIRVRGITTPIIIITMKDAINYKLMGFKYGANDYLCKPFNKLELRARIKNVLRTCHELQNYKKHEYDELEIFPEKRIVIHKEIVLELRNREFDLLLHLIKNKGRAISRDDLINVIWNANIDITSNTIDVHIKNLRNKLGMINKGHIIKTVYGIGYKLEDESKRKD